jgi:hypothetical protein
LEFSKTVSEKSNSGAHKNSSTLPKLTQASEIYRMDSGTEPSAPRIVEKIAKLVKTIAGDNS